LVHLLDLSEVKPERLDERAGEHGRSVLRSLPLTDEDGSAVEVDILDPKA
jgi:hypothetical protein